MKTIPMVILIVSVIGNLIGAYILYKSVRLREENGLLHKYQDDLLNKFKNLQADYPAISFYSEENRRLLTETSPAQRKEMTVFFGASITKSWDTEKHFPDLKIINRGIGAQSDMQLLARFSSDVLRLNPGRVVIKFCSGNFHPQADPEMIWDEYETMARMAQVRNIEPILATVVPLTRRAEEYENYSMTEHIKEFNNRIRKFAADEKLVLADYYQAMADKEGYLPDSLARDAIHPDEEGYLIMTRVIKPLLE